MCIRSAAERERLLELARASKLERRTLDLTPMLPGERGDSAALSFAQQRLWFLEQLGGGGSAYHISRRLRLRGELDRGALARALDRIVERHEVLRTTFHTVAGEPVQFIAAECRFPLVYQELDGDEEELSAVMAAETSAPIDLAHGPLIRGRLVRLADDDHVLLITMHHIVSDGWSMGVFTGELGALYTAFVRGEPDPLPALPVQYADFSAWQRRWVNGEALSKQADFWRNTLAGAPELLELPADRARPRVQDHAGAMAALELDEELAADLRALSQRHRTTLHTTLLAAWAAVLGRLAGQDDVVIGTPSANRGRAEVEGLIGFFVNTLVLRVDLSGEPTVAELLAHVKAGALGAQDHRDIPFEQVVELAQPVRSLSHTPLFQVMFTWQNTPREGLGLPGLKLGTEPGAAHATARFDLSLALQEAGGRIVGGVTYATALFEEATVERYLGYFRAFLQGMVADDGGRVDRLPLLPADERLEMVQAWNATAAEFPSEACIHQLFEAQAERTPHAEALSCEGERLTYGELNARANRLAHYLVERGVGPDARVAVCVERGVEMVVGLLAVLKAGGCYVPLDPSYPADRLRYMLADSAPLALLSQARLAGMAVALADGLGLPVIELDAGAAEWAGRPESDPVRAELTADHLMYLIYTSGSTGPPRGVMNQHRCVVNRLAWGQRVWRAQPGEAVLQNASFSFDVSVREIFWPLVSGARVVLLKPEGSRDPGYLAETIRRERVGTACFVPSMLQLFLEHPDAALCTGLLRVVCSGEALPAAVARRFHRALPRVALHNVYGPSEAATAVASLHFRADDDTRATVPIGRPIANTRVYILDAAGEPVPAGVAGELYIGGAGVARGYWNRPVLTAQRFVADPFSGEPGARMYRTGDLGRWLPDGTLEFLGRNDEQVKVRGFRIELGEIEGALSSHFAVRHAVTMVREDAPGDRRLVAYYVPAAEVEAEVLRSHLAARLPEHMVPAAYVRMDIFPLTPNGKVDREALPAPDGTAFATRGYEAPVGETEELLAAVWAELLGVERVGRNDHFFELGGHSLRAVQVVARVRRVLGVEVALADLFTHPTVEAFAARLRGSRPDAAPDRAIPMRAGGTQRPLFLVYEGTGSTAYAQALWPHLHAEIPIYALPAPEPGLATVEEMAARLAGMIREAQPEGPYRLAGWSFGGTLAYAAAAHLLGRGHAVEFVGMMDTRYQPAGGDEYALLLRMLRMEEGLEGAAGASLGQLARAAAEMELQELVERCHAAGILPARVGVERVQAMLDRLRGNRHAMRGYAVPPIHVPVHLFPARDGSGTDPWLGWRAVLPAELLRTTEVPGTHLTMMAAPNAEVLGGALSAAIAAASPAPRGYGAYTGDRTAVYLPGLRLVAALETSAGD